MRIYTEEELLILHDSNLKANFVADIIQVSAITVYRYRKNHGISVTRGPAQGPRPYNIKRETRVCENPKCDNEFETKPASSKRFCCKSCALICVAKPPYSKNGGSKPFLPTTPAYTRYKNKVHRLSDKTYLENIDLINPNRHKRTLCGVDGGYQLDHIISIKECFESGISPEEASRVENLRILPWKDNLMRQYK